MNRRNRSRFRTIVSSPITMFLALVLLILLGRAAYNIHAKAAESDLKLSEAQANLDHLERNRDAIHGKIDNLSTEAGVEASMREKYHAVAPGESVAVIIDSDDGQADGLVATTTAPTASWWRRFLSAIGL